MRELQESEAFFIGIAVGVNLYQGRILEAHRRRLPLMIDGDLYYIQSGRERLQEVIDKICQWQNGNLIVVCSAELTSRLDGKLIKAKKYRDL